MAETFAKVRDAQSLQLRNQAFFQRARGRDDAMGQQVRVSGDVTQTFFRVRVAQVTLVHRCMPPFRSFFS